MQKKIKNTSKKVYPIEKQELKIPSLIQKKIHLSPQKIKEAVTKKEKEINQDMFVQDAEAPLLVPKNLETFFPAERVEEREINALENVVAAALSSPLNNQNTTTLSPYALNTKQASDNYALSSNYALADNYGMSTEEKNISSGFDDQKERSTIPFSHDIDVNTLQQGYVSKKSKKMW